MGLSYQSEFIFIGKGDESFLENYSYELSEDPSGRGGKIAMSLEIINNLSEAEDIGEIIFSNFKEKFYEDTAADPFERFEAGLKAANSAIETLKEEKVSRFIGNLNVAVSAVVDDTLFVSTTGDSEVYLVRKRFTSILSEGLAEDSKKEVFVNIANGTLEPGDRVVLSSSRLLRYVTKAELGKIFTDSQNVGDALTELQDVIMTEILGRSAVIGIAVSKEAKELGGEFEEGGGERGEGRGSRVSDFLRGVVLRIPKLEKFAALLPKKLELPKVSAKLPSFSSLPKIRFHERMGKEKILLLAVGLLVILVSGTFWLRTRGNQKRAIAEQQAKLNHSRELMNDAATVGQFDKPKASELLIAAEKTAHEVLGTRFLRSDAVKVLDDIQASRDTLDEVRRVTAPTLVADFSAKRPTVNALGLLSLKDRLYGFEYNALYEMVLDKLQEPLTMTDTETVILGTDFSDDNSLLFLTRTGKMIRYKEGRFEQAVTKDGIWKKGVDMKTYHDRLYVLDPERNQIWRYSQTRDGFTEGTGYNQDADIKTGVALAIDSSVFVLHADGSITQLYQGQKKEYPLRRPPLNVLAAPTKIYTSTDLGFLYILEPSKQRVVVFRKDAQNGGAQYQTQYVFEKTGELQDLVVTDNRLYVADEKRVYFVNLSGL